MKKKKKSQRGKKSIYYIFVEQFYFHLKMGIEISKHLRLRIFNATNRFEKKKKRIKGAKKSFIRKFDRIITVQCQTDKINRPVFIR